MSYQRRVNWRPKVIKVKKRKLCTCRKHRKLRRYDAKAIRAAGRRQVHDIVQGIWKS